MKATSKYLAPALACAALGAGLFACTDREVARVDPRQNKEQEKEIPVQINRNLDILFVIDNSGSMRDEQTSLAGNFQNFINVLENIEGGLPDVHIGVVSTDVGAGNNGINGCAPPGDNGLLLNAPAGGNGCSTPSDKYIEDIALEDGVTRDRNYSGSLADTFSCIAQLGITGCGFEQPLEAMRRALNGSNVQNQGFLRDNAFLAVILISDEDDCSVTDPSMFDSSAAQDTPTSALGPLSSFRCFEFGVQCDPDEPRAAGPRQDCVPRADSQYMPVVDDYVNFLKSLKEDPSQIIVAGIIGNPTPVSVGSEEGEPTLEPSCVSNAGEAAPAVRLSYFLDAFPQRSTTTTICNEDLSDALTVIAELLAEVLGNPCIDGDLQVDDAGQPTDCTVADVRNLNQEDQEEFLIPRCDLSSSKPCYTFEIDTTNCSMTPTQLALVIDRGETEPAANTTVVARCAAN